MNDIVLCLMYFELVKAGPIKWTCCCCKEAKSQHITNVMHCFVSPTLDSFSFRPPLNQSFLSRSLSQLTGACMWKLAHVNHKMVNNPGRAQSAEKSQKLYNFTAFSTISMRSCVYSFYMMNDKIKPIKRKKESDLNGKYQTEDNFFMFIVTAFPHPIRSQRFLFLHSSLLIEMKSNALLLVSLRWTFD